MRCPEQTSALNISVIQMYSRACWDFGIMICILVMRNLKCTGFTKTLQLHIQVERRMRLWLHWPVTAVGIVGGESAVLEFVRCALFWFLWLDVTADPWAIAALHKHSSIKWHFSRIQAFLHKRTNRDSQVFITAVHWGYIHAVSVLLTGSQIVLFIKQFKYCVWRIADEVGPLFNSRLFQ